MTTKAPEKTSNRDPGLTIRVPLEVLVNLRKKADRLAKRMPLLSSEEVLRRLAIRAVTLGADDDRLTEKDAE